MKKKEMSPFQIFLSALKLSSITFGGGFVMIGMMERKFVQETEILRSEEMMDIAAIAQSAPGAVAVNAWILLGYRLAGLPGSLIATLGAVLPPLFIIGVLSLIYQQFITSPVVATIMKGLQIGVAAIIVDLVLTLIQAIAGDSRPIDFLLAFAALIALLQFNVPIYMIILIYAALGLWRKK